MKIKNFFPTILLLLFIIFIVSFTFKMFSNTKTIRLSKDVCRKLIDSSTETDALIETTVIDSDWKLLKNNKYHYQFKYPAGYESDYNTSEYVLLKEGVGTDLSRGMYFWVQLLGIIPGEIQNQIPNFSQLVSKQSQGYEVLTNPQSPLRSGSGLYYIDYYFRDKQNLLFEMRFEGEDLGRFNSLINEITKSWKYEAVTSPDNNLILYGQASVTTGDCMPIVCDNSPCSGSDCRTNPLKNSKVRVYPLTKNILSKPKAITSTVTDEDGYYCTALPQGSYSIFVEYKGKQLCSGGDGSGFACPTTLFERPERYDLRLNLAGY